jgi:hypothetical protein
MSENDPLPFGIGRVLGRESRDGEGVQFQWLGNATFNPRGTFLPGWLDPTDRKFYFQPKPRQRNTPSSCAVTKEDVITPGFHILTDTNRLSMNTRTAITSSKEVEQMFKRDVIHLFTPKVTDL